MVQVHWAHGFGPKQLFNYEKGESILRLNKLSDEECALLKAAPLGGFQGSRLRDQVTVEEPGALHQFATALDDEQQQMVFKDSSKVYGIRTKYEDTTDMEWQHHFSPPPLPQQHHHHYHHHRHGNEYVLSSRQQEEQQQEQRPNGYYDQHGNYIYIIPAGYTLHDRHYPPPVGAVATATALAPSTYYGHQPPLPLSVAYQTSHQQEQQHHAQQYPRISSPGSPQQPPPPPPPPMGNQYHDRYSPSARHYSPYNDYHDHYQHEKYYQEDVHSPTGEYSTDYYHDL